MLGLNLTLGPYIAGQTAIQRAVRLLTSAGPGAWYDPSDLTTLFQDSAGTTPVTAVEQPVGLMLDKSQGLVLGAELVTNRDFSAGNTGWARSGPSWSGLTGAMVNDGTNVVWAQCQQNSIIATGKTYRIEFDLTRTSGTLSVWLNGSQLVQAGIATSGRKTFTVASTVSGNFMVEASAGAVLSIDNISVRELPGNHLIQPTATSRPTLKQDSNGTYHLHFDGVDDSMYTAASVDFNSLPADGQVKRNLLMASEAFDDAAWAKTGSTVAANAIAAPDGTMTADKLVETAATSTHLTKRLVTTLAVAYTYSVYAKAAERPRLLLVNNSVANAFAIFDLSIGTVPTTGSATTSSITPVGDGWYRCAITLTCTAAVNDFQARIGTASTDTYTGDGTSGIYVWGAQLEAGSTATAYQKTGTDKMTVFAGLHKASDAAAGVLVELSGAPTGASNGSFSFTAPASAASNIRWISRGTVLWAATGSGVPAPATRVAAGIGDISGDVSTLRLNGVQADTSSGDQGTGNYGNYPLYIGRRNNDSLPFNGRIYQLAIRGRAMTAEEVTTIETFINSKTKAF